jgi:hypothetical protein
MDQSDAEGPGPFDSNTNSIAQWAAVEALTGPQESVGIMLGNTRRAGVVIERVERDSRDSNAASLKVRFMRFRTCVDV